MVKRKDWKKLVLEQSKIDNAEIITEVGDKVNRSFRIFFKCNCGEENDKSIERYGVENPFQSEVVKEKMRKTWIKNYGMENPTQDDDIREKQKQTSFNRYGVENVLIAQTLWHSKNSRYSKFMNE